MPDTGLFTSGHTPGRFHLVKTRTKDKAHGTTIAVRSGEYIAQIDQCDPISKADATHYLSTLEPVIEALREAAR
jgi:hypothetical protein